MVPLAKKVIAIIYIENDNYPEYKIILVPAKSIPKPPKEIVLNDIENGNLRIVKSKMEKFKQFMEKYK